MKLFYMLYFHLILLSSTFQVLVRSISLPGARWHSYSAYTADDVTVCDATRSLSCYNGGVCSNTIVPRCLCVLGYTGTTCSQKLVAHIPKLSGSSYLKFSVHSYLLQEDFTIDIQLVAEYSTGLLFYSSGSGISDFISVYLRNQNVVYRFDCGNGVGSLSSNSTVILGRETPIRFGWRVGRAVLSVGNEDFIYSTPQAENKHRQIDGLKLLYLGGYQNLQEIRRRAEVNIGVRGCVLSLRINHRPLQLYASPERSLNSVIGGRDIGDCSSGVCTNNPSICGIGDCISTSRTDFRCLCPLGTSGNICDQDEDIENGEYISRLSDNSYIRFSTALRPVVNETVIRLTLKPSSHDGLILYVGSSAVSTDFLALYLSDGYLTLTVDLGSTPTTLRLNQPNKLFLDRWCSVIVNRTLNELTLELVDVGKQSITLPTSYAQLDADHQSLFLGGYPDLGGISGALNITGSYQGCMMQMSVNEIPMVPNAALYGINVESCPHACNRLTLPCGRTGRCVPNKGLYDCYCTVGYSGIACDQVLGRVTVPSFNGTGYLAFNEKYILDGPYFSINSRFWDIRITVRLDCKSCQIMWMGASDTTRRSDFLSVHIGASGYLTVRFDLGGGVTTKTLDYVKLNDNLWHHIRLHRRENLAALMVDDFDMMNFQSWNANYGELNADSWLYIGGTPPGLGWADISSLTGCIRRLELDDMYIPLAESIADGENIHQCTNV